MNIGAVKGRNNGKDGAERKEWFDLIIRPPFVPSMTLSMHKNKNRIKDSEPEYKIWYNYNRKGEAFRGVEIGAIWRKVSKDGKTTYFNGFIESPAFASGKLNITLFETKVFKNDDPSKIDWLYDVNWQAPKTNNSNSYNQSSYAEPVSYTSNNQGGEIPVYVENAQGGGIPADEARNYM